MKVGFDISQLAHRGGVATYTRNLTGGLDEIKDLEMVYFYSSLRKPYQGDLSNVKEFKIPPTIQEIIFNKFRFFPIENLIGKIDIFHSSDWIQPSSKAKKITTYHDLIPIKFPKWSDPKIVEVHKKRLELVEQEIDMIIAVSESTKRDLLECSKIPNEKIKVIYEASEYTIQNKAKVEDFRQKMKLPKNFVLVLGGIGERKNLKRAQEAAKNYHLVITGETFPWVSDSELPLLYSAATVLLYPSLYEGFGLPILDAMSVGTPVITSNISSMPEIGGSAALYVNPMDVLDMEKKLNLIMEDKKLAQELVKKGFQQAKKFSWKKCVQETALVYQTLYG